MKIENIENIAGNAKVVASKWTLTFPSMFSMFLIFILGDQL